MPQASEEDRERMRKWFGSIGETGPMRFLESHGYKLQGDWHWERPTPSHNISQDEWYCLAFLMDEWDFGGIFPNV